MTARQAAVLAASALVVMLVALPAGLIGEPVHLMSATISLALTVPVAFGTFGLTRWMAGRHPLGGVVGMLVGTVVRLVVAFGGGGAAVLLAPELRSSGIVFWLWLLFAYLSTLLAETALLVRTSPLAVGGAVSEKG